MSINYPKEDALRWEKQIGKGKWEECKKPDYKTDFNKDTREIVNLNIQDEKQMTIFDYIAS